MRGIIRLASARVNTFFVTFSRQTTSRQVLACMGATEAGEGGAPYHGTGAVDSVAGSSALSVTDTGSPRTAV
jgi:hypothetical protein